MQKTMARALGAAALLAVLLAAVPGAAPPPSGDPDLVIVGAGISGLSAALEAARGGATVQLIDLWSVFGGHAVMSTGGLSIVDSPLQRRLGIEDSPELAYRDFFEWGTDPDPAWVRTYVDRSRELVWDFVTELGVTFDGIESVPGNSVPRFHQTHDRGVGLVVPIYQASLQQPGIAFRWNVRVTDLVIEGGRVVGVRGRDLRGGKAFEQRGRAVMLATGGFQSNLELLRDHWPEALPFPERMLAGSGVNSMGSGLQLAQQAGGTLFNMDHQWNYISGIPDPRYPGRGLSATIGGSIRLNLDGERFIDEGASPREAFPALLRQPGATYWAVFDEDSRDSIWISGSDWVTRERVDELVWGTPDLVRSGATLDELASATGLPAAALKASVAAAGNPLDRPPFHAVQFFPLSRKSMGGIRIDASCRVLDAGGGVIPGLWAVGEAAGFGGLNGSAGLEGTFLGPSIVTGRLGARSVLEELGVEGSGSDITATLARDTARSVEPAAAPANVACLECHDLETDVGAGRPGYEHFERSHSKVLDRDMSCGSCHPGMLPFDIDSHVIDRSAQADACRACHVAVEYERGQG